MKLVKNQNESQKKQTVSDNEAEESFIKILKCIQINFMIIVI